MFRWFTADLHVHTCLSPCSALAMSPRRIVAEALQRRIDIIGIADHNTAGNAAAVLRAAAKTGLSVLPGMEICTREEVHVLALLEDPQTAAALQSLVQARLCGRNDPDAFGIQVLVNEDDEVEGYEERLLIGATELTVEDTVAAIHGLGGVAIAAHVDRESYSVIGQLGFIPDGLALDALEISTMTNDQRAEEAFRQYRHLPFIRNSDAHTPDRIGSGSTRFLLKEPTLPEIRKALRGLEGRRVTTASPNG